MSEINHGGCLTESGSFNVLSSLPVLADEAAASNSFQEYTGFVGEYVSRPVQCVSITAVPSTINKGEQAQIQYQLRDADDATINPSVGGVAVPAGTAVVTPTVTTTYTLVATRGTFDTRCSVTITVNDDGGNQGNNNGGGGVGGTGGGNGGNLGSGYYGGGGFYGGGDPEDPQDPSDPVDPTDPVDPQQPEEPTEPQDPSGPASPAEPTEPVEIDDEITIPGEVLTPAILRPTEITPSEPGEQTSDDGQIGTSVGNIGKDRDRDDVLREAAGEKDVMTYPLIDPPGLAALHCAPDQKPHYAYILWIVIVLLLIIVFYQRIEIKDLLNQRKK